MADARAALAGVAIGASAVLVLLQLRERHQSRAKHSRAAANLTALRSWRRIAAGDAPDCGAPALDAESGVYYNSVDAPMWLRPLFSDTTHRRVLCREWEDAEWRAASGWKGSDLIHAPCGRGVQVLAYFWREADLTLTGIVRFGPDAESHRGLCHGGAMTSLMDDLCGHICFFAGPAPWCGATVKVNCNLSKPVRVGDVLKLIGRIDRRDDNGKGRTKMYISATLVGEDGAKYCELDGLAITPVASARAARASRALARRPSQLSRALPAYFACHVCKAFTRVMRPRSVDHQRRRRPAHVAAARPRAMRLGLGALTTAVPHECSGSAWRRPAGADGTRAMLRHTYYA